MSLVTELPRDRIYCRYCNSNRMAAISMMVADGSTLTMLACRRCEQRHWADESGTVSLADVFDRAGKRPEAS